MRRPYLLFYLLSLGACSLAVGLARAQQAPPQVSDPRPVNGLTPPVLIKYVKPKYPHTGLLKLHANAGVVKVYVIVDTEGVPQGVKVVEPAKAPELNKAAIDAVQRYRFKPAMKEGKPVKVDLYVEVNFQLL